MVFYELDNPIGPLAAALAVIVGIPIAVLGLSLVFLVINGIQWLLDISGIQERLEKRAIRRYHRGG